MENVKERATLTNELPEAEKNEIIKTVKRDNDITLGNLIKFDTGMKKAGFIFAIIFSIASFICSVSLRNAKPLTETKLLVRTITETELSGNAKIITETEPSGNAKIITETEPSGNAKSVTTTEPLKNGNINIGLLMILSSIFFSGVACLIASKNNKNIIRDYYRLLKLSSDMYERMKIE